MWEWIRGLARTFWCCVLVFGDLLACAGWMEVGGCYQMACVMWLEVRRVVVQT